MKFSNMLYKRPDFNEIIEYIDDSVKNLINANSSKEVIDLVYEFDKKLIDVDTEIMIAYVRHTINVNDEFYKKEQEWLDERTPILTTKRTVFYKALFNSKYRSDLEKEFGKYIFDKMECEFAISDEAVEFMQKENVLIAEYNEIIANSQIEFRGEKYTLSQLNKFSNDLDRDIRKEVLRLKSKFFKDNQSKIDRIYDELVKVRTEMAKVLGFNNYVELAYKLLKRTDYNASDVKQYIEKIKKYFTPLAVKLREQQAIKLGISDFKFYDRDIIFKDGNSKPLGDEKFILKNAQKMYRELSPETGKFFDFMIENELLDLVAKKGKRSGGYCTSFNKYKSPFIFSNFNGTNSDIDVITHEAGHAFQNFMSQDMKLSDYIWPTYESSEIHSMSMEFLTWPWMDLFFGKDANRYRYSALKDSIEFLPYGATIDHFQHWVYENPNATPDQRNKKFHELELIYQPDLDYDDELFNEGTYWYKQQHIFAIPFYYIDYTLAQVCAFQYLLKYLDNRETTLKDYFNLCKAGGSASFFELLKIGNLENPITTNIMEEIIEPLQDVLYTLQEEIY